MEKETKPTAGVLGLQIDPAKFAALLLAVSLASMAAAKGAEKLGVASLGGLTAWTIALAFLLFFAVANAVFSISSKSEMRYFARSVYAFLGLAAANGVGAWLFSGIAVADAGSYKKLYIVVAIGFLVFISMVSAMRKIVAFAEKEEWNQPRMRR